MPEVDKKKLKTVFLRKRKILTEVEYDKRNAKLFYIFSQLLEELNPNLVHTFLPIAAQMEPDTWIMVKYMKAMGVKISVSRMLEVGGLEHYLFEGKKQLEENKWGILEPTSGQKVDAQLIDLVLVPLVVFDQVGHRIGYGKGYYDQFLSTCTPGCHKVGLSLLTPLDAIPYVESHDIPLDFCISPVGLHRFKK